MQKNLPNHFHLNFSLLKVQLYPRQEAQFLRAMSPFKKSVVSCPSDFHVWLIRFIRTLFRWVWFDSRIWFGTYKAYKILLGSLHRLHVFFFLALPKVRLIQNSRPKTVFLRHPLSFKGFNCHCYSANHACESSNTIDTSATSHLALQLLVHCFEWPRLRELGDGRWVHKRKNP